MIDIAFFTERLSALFQDSVVTDEDTIEEYKKNGQPHKDPELLKTIKIHETGHTVVAHCLGCYITFQSVLKHPGSRGISLYETPSSFEELNYDDQINRLAVLYGGEEAEKMIFGEEHISDGFGYSSDKENISRHLKNKLRQLWQDDNPTDKAKIDSYIQVMLKQHHKFTPKDDAYVEQAYNLEAKAIKLAKDTLATNRDFFNAIVSQTDERPVMSGDQIRSIYGDITEP